jgi:hypothetical protein
MSLNRHQKHRLRVIEAGLCGSDPELGAKFVLFGRLHEGEDVPAREQTPESQHRSRPVHWIGAVITAITAAPRRGRVGTSAAEPERTSDGGETGDQHDHSGPAS